MTECTHEIPEGEPCCPCGAIYTVEAEADLAVIDRLLATEPINEGGGPDA